jgi:hypothetical protein
MLAFYSLGHARFAGVAETVGPSGRENGRQGIQDSAALSVLGRLCVT